VKQYAFYKNNFEIVKSKEKINYKQLKEFITNEIEILFITVCINQIWLLSKWELGCKFN